MLHSFPHVSPTQPAVALSHGNVRGQVSVDAKALVTLGHSKGQHHGDSWFILSLGKHMSHWLKSQPLAVQFHVHSLFYFIFTIHASLLDIMLTQLPCAANK